MWKNILLECFVCMFAPMPFFKGIHIPENNTDYGIYVKYDLNDFLTALMFM